MSLKPLTEKSSIIVSDKADQEEANPFARLNGDRIVSAVKNAVSKKISKEPDSQFSKEGFSQLELDSALQDKSGYTSIGAHKTKKKYLKYALMALLPIVTVCIVAVYARSPTHNPPLYNKADPLGSAIPPLLKNNAPCSNTLTSGYHTIASGGMQRQFLLHVPASAATVTDTRVPLVVLLHGYLSNPEQIRDKINANPVLEQKGWIGVYPKGEGTPFNSWNGAGCCPGAVSDDISFIKAVVDKLVDNMCVDRDNVFVAGFSNGAFMTHRLACSAGLNSLGTPYFKGYTTHSGLVGLSFSCRPQWKVPILSFHAVDDDVVGFNGTSPSIYAEPNQVWNTFFQTAGLWEGLNQCDPQGGVVFSYSNTTTCKYHLNCTGVPMKYCWITGGLKHHWSGEPSGAGTASQIPATQTMFTFFDWLTHIPSSSLLN